MRSITASKRPSSGAPPASPRSQRSRIQASRTGDRFVVEVIDDGRGIDPAMVRRKARERGLMPPDELAALSDEQVIDLIFSAGFSTAAEVSDISGRGVGMDVVRTTIEQIGGRVSLTSAVGAGTTVRLDLPHEHCDVAHHGGRGRRPGVRHSDGCRDRRPFA